MPGGQYAAISGTKNALNDICEAIERLKSVESSTAAFFIRYLAYELLPTMLQIDHGLLALSYVLHRFKLAKRSS